MARYSTRSTKKRSTAKPSSKAKASSASSHVPVPSAPAQPPSSLPLGATKTQPTKILDTFPNPRPERDYEIRFDCPEFTCLCPKTGQPDFATIRIRYIPDQTCVELKSLKLYLWSYRNEGAFHEAVTNAILDDIVAATQPRLITVEGDFFIRGGIRTVVEVTHRKPSPAPRTPTDGPQAVSTGKPLAKDAAEVTPRKP